MKAVKYIFLALVLFFSAAAFSQTSLTVTSTNTVSGYVVMKSSDWKKYNDSLRKVASAAAAKTFGDSINQLVKVVDAREFLSPVDSLGKVFQLSGKPLGLEQAFSDAGTLLFPGVDYSMTVSGKVTLKGGGRKTIYVIYQKVTQ